MDKNPTLTLTDREKNLYILYKTFASELDTRELFCRDWNYIANLLFNGAEKEIPDMILDMIMVWLDAV